MKTTVLISVALLISTSMSGCALFTPMTPAETKERQALIARNQASRADTGVKKQTRKTRRARKDAEKKLRAYWDYSKGKKSAKAGTFGLRGCQLKVCRTK